MILAVALLAAVHFISQKAPEALRSAIERSFGKKVIIRSIDYQFPWVFELRGFEVKESEPFAGETAFSVDRVRLDVSPMSLSEKKLILDRVQVENAVMVVRKYRGRWAHALSGAIERDRTPARADQPSEKREASHRTLPLEIRQFTLSQSAFQFIDYDVDANGFVIVLDEIQAKVKNIYFPFSANKTFYEIRARLPQGRNQPPGLLETSGWTGFASKDTDANLSLRGVFLPYFRPYYAQVTQAAIENGTLDSRTNLRIENRDLVINTDLEVTSLLFQSYELNDQLFGLNADEILSFLKDQSGRLRFQIVARWNLDDRGVRAKDVIRQSIERSIKNTVLGNVGNILQNTIQKIGQGGVDGTTEDIQETVKKFKALFRGD